MLVKQSHLDQCIIDCLQNHYGIKVIMLTFLHLGADTTASVYEAETQDKTSYFVKLKRGYHHDMGITIVQLLHNAGIQHVIPRDITHYVVALRVYS